MLGFSAPTVLCGPALQRSDYPFVKISDHEACHTRKLIRRCSPDSNDINRAAKSHRGRPKMLNRDAAIRDVTPGCR